MDIKEAMRIIKAAAEGVNPFTGEVLPRDSLYQHPDMVRAMYRALGALEVQQKRELKQKDVPENAGKPWSDEDDKRLTAEFDAGAKIGDMARIFKRSIGAIEARLVSMGKIQPPSRPK
jgi:hypothetical protein